MNGHNWFDSTGQDKGKITLQKIIIQFPCKGNKSLLLPHTSAAVSNRSPCQRNGFYDGSWAFTMKTQGVNTGQHKTAWELWLQAKCNNKKEPSYTRETKTALADYGGSVMFSLQRITCPSLAQSSGRILLLFQLPWTLPLTLGKYTSCTGRRDQNTKAITTSSILLQHQSHLSWKRFQMQVALEFCFEFTGSPAREWGHLYGKSISQSPLKLVLLDGAKTRSFSFSVR